MTELLQAVIFGVLAGGVYALMATGLTLTFGVMKIVNLAQGAFLILSAYLCWTLWAHLRIDPLLGSLIVTVPMVKAWLKYPGVAAVGFGPQMRAMTASAMRATANVTTIVSPWSCRCTRSTTNR